MSDPLSISGLTNRAEPVTAPDSPYIQPTFNYALRIWWAFVWPISVVTVILGLFTPLNSFVAQCALTFAGMYYILGKNFRHFRIALVSNADLDHPQPLPRTVDRVARGWFAYSWRVWIFVLILFAVASIPLSIIAAAFSAMPRIANGIAVFSLVSLEAAVGLYVLYNDILEEDFDDARVCLLPRDNAPATGQASPLAGPAVS